MTSDVCTVGSCKQKLLKLTSIDSGLCFNVRCKSTIGLRDKTRQVDKCGDKFDRQNFDSLIFLFFMSSKQNLLNPAKN